MCMDFYGLPWWLSGPSPVNSGDVWVQSLGWGDPAGKEMATDSSIFAQEIPWKVEPGGQ